MRLRNEIIHYGYTQLTLPHGLVDAGEERNWGARASHGLTTSNDKCFD